jgi:hypothetical protein
VEEGDLDEASCVRGRRGVEVVDPGTDIPNTATVSGNNLDRGTREAAERRELGPLRLFVAEEWAHRARVSSPS